jgi:hypothetical protein
MASRHRGAGPVASPRVRGTRARFGTVLFASSALFAVWLPRIPDVQARLGLDDKTLGLALLGQGVGTLLGSLASARMGAPSTTRRVALIATGIYCSSVVTAAIAVNVIMLFAALMVVGACASVLDVAANAEAAHLESAGAPGVLPHLQGMYSLGTLRGAALGALGAGLHAEALPYVGTLACTAAAAALLALAGVGTCRETYRTEIRPTHAVAARRGALGVAAFAALFVEAVVSDWSAAYLRAVLGASPSVDGTGFLAFSATMAVGGIAAPTLLGRWPAWSLARGGACGILGGGTVVVIAPTPLLAVVGFG